MAASRAYSAGRVRPKTTHEPAPALGIQKAFGAVRLISTDHFGNDRFARRQYGRHNEDNDLSSRDSPDGAPKRLLARIATECLLRPDCAFGSADQGYEEQARF